MSVIPIPLARPTRKAGSPPRFQLRYPVARVDFAPMGATSVNLGELLSRDVNPERLRIPSFTECTLSGSGLPYIRLRFSWPGYEDYDIEERIKLTSGTPNCDIAVAIACTYNSFLQQAQRLRPSDPTYQISPGSPFADIRNIGLRAIVHDEGEIFVAEVEVSAVRAPRRRME